MNVAGRVPDIHYAKSGGLNTAYSVIGYGPDLVVAPGFISHLDIMWEGPSVVHFYSRLACFRRVVVFDKRGTGLSDPVSTRRRWKSPSKTWPPSWTRRDANAAPGRASALPLAASTPSRVWRASGGCSGLRVDAVGLVSWLRRPIVREPQAIGDQVPQALLRGQPRVGAALPQNGFRPSSWLAADVWRVSA